MEVEQFHSDFHACIVQINGKRHKATPLPCPRLEKALRSVLYWLDMSLLEQIQGPRDLDRLSLRDLDKLSREIRRRIAEVVPRNGGHYASNLGVVELTIALHRVFHSPEDALVWDVGHQCYAHKMLTGRAARFATLRKEGGLSGFPRPQESIHDMFPVGHASTAISSALGLLQARMMRHEKGRVIAVVGDGGLTAGMALEGLSNAGHLGLPLIIVLNDNRMSISPSVGALSRYLSRLSATVRYQSFRSRVDALVLGIPHYGKTLHALITRAKRAVKAVVFKDNLFVDFGFEYVGPIDGHNIPALVAVFEQVKRLNRPVVVHVVTRKGKGVTDAEEDPETYHGIAPACADVPEGAQQAGWSFTRHAASILVQKAQEDSRIVAITAAMAGGTGLAELSRRMPSRVFDVGIAEQHAVTFAAGLARGGLRPVVAIYSTFMQRALDQVFQDVALARLPVLFMLDRAGAVADDGETHQGIYDIALYKAMPNLVLMAPADGAEMELMVDFALKLDGPAMLRYPKDVAACVQSSPEPLQPGRGVFLRQRQDAKILVVGVGCLAPLAAEVSDLLAARGVLCDVYNPRFLSALDEAFMLNVLTCYRGMVVVEDGVVQGGFGETLASLAARAGLQLAIELKGFDTIPLPHASRQALLAAAGLDREGLTAAISMLHARLSRTTCQVIRFEKPDVQEGAMLHARF